MTADTREKIDLWYLKQLTARRAERDQCAGWLYRSIASDQVEQLHYEWSRAKMSPFQDLISTIITVGPDDVEAWRSALRMGVDALGLTPAGLSERFAASIPSVEGWLDGGSQPVSELRSLVLDYLLEQALADRPVPESKLRSEPVPEQLAREVPTEVGAGLNANSSSDDKRTGALKLLEEWGTPPAKLLASVDPSGSEPSAQSAAAQAQLAEDFQHGYAAGLREGLQIAKDLGWVAGESLMPRIVWDDVAREIEARIDAVLAATSKTPDR